MNRKEAQRWKRSKARLLLPIVYVRGFAMTGGEIEDTTSDPFNGFNVGSTLLRTGWTGDAARHIFESPVLRLSQPPYDYRLAFSNGIRGLDEETKAVLRDWRKPADDASRPPAAVLAIYRYYDVASTVFGEGKRPGMETYGWGLGRLVTDVLEATGAEGAYIVAHSMGGLVARTFLQNEDVLDGSVPGTEERCAAVRALLGREERLTVTPAQWKHARGSVRRLFTYGTPHDGITGHGGIGNALLEPLGLELSNFERDRMCEYLGGAGRAGSLDGKFPIGDVFCLVGTAAADYPAAGGFARRLVGGRSDGLVEMDNAVVCDPDRSPGAAPGATVLAARAYVRRAHSGPFGMVNSEEGFGNLTRFLFGDVRVDADLIVRRVDLPEELAREKAAREAKGEDATIRASYAIETFLRVRGARWAMTERTARDGSQIFRRYDQLFPGKRPAPGLKQTPELIRDRERHHRVELFTAFLDTSRRTLAAAERVEGRDLTGTLGFALRLRVAVPDYEMDGRFWGKNHYEGSALLDRDLVFLAYPEEVPGGWNLAWGVNSAATVNPTLRIVTREMGEEPREVAYDDVVEEARRRADGDALEFWIPAFEKGPPTFAAWIRLTTRRWNAPPGAGASDDAAGR